MDKLDKDILLSPIRETRYGGPTSADLPPVVLFLAHSDAEGTALSYEEPVRSPASYTQILDKRIRYYVDHAHQIFIRFINDTFSARHAFNARVELLKTESTLKDISGDLFSRRADIVAKITDADGTFAVYHVEFETWPVLAELPARVYSYRLPLKWDLIEAGNSGELWELNPYSAVVCLHEWTSWPDELHIRTVRNSAGNDESVETIPLVKIGSLSPDTIIREDRFFLSVFSPFRYSSGAGSRAKIADPVERTEMLDAFRAVLGWLSDSVSSGKLSRSEFDEIMTLMTKNFGLVFEKHPDVLKEVETMIATTNAGLDWELSSVREAREEMLAGVIRDLLPIMSMDFIVDMVMRRGAMDRSAAIAMIKAVQDSLQPAAN